MPPTSTTRPSRHRNSITRGLVIADSFFYTLPCRLHETEALSKMSPVLLVKRSPPQPPGFFAQALEQLTVIEVDRIAAGRLP